MQYLFGIAWDLIPRNQFFLQSGILQRGLWNSMGACPYFESCIRENY